MTVRARAACLALVAGVESSLGDALRTQPYVELVDPAMLDGNE